MKMQRMFARASTVAALLLTAACGHISVYDGTGASKNEVGIKFYAPKPYILVARTGAQAAPVSVEVVYLPDLSQPYYARTVAGLGSSKLDLAFSNGILTTVGQQTDPKLTELITSLAGVPGSLATAAKTRAETSVMLRKEATDAQLKEAADTLAAASTTLSGLLDDDAYASVVTKNQKTTLGQIAKALDKHAASLQQPGAGAKVADIAKGVESTQKSLAGVKPSDTQNASEPGKKFWGQVASVSTEVAGAAKKLKPAETPPQTFSLYEIATVDGITVLREVDFPKAAK
ncbi:hypothetical protein [Lysobacter enzymogenes]|nr:hypothetical protein [Lysobacter enzymogenes]